MIVEIALYFILSAFVVFGLLIALWLISIIVKDASLIDIFWGFGFLTVAITCLCLKPVKSPYLILLAAMPIMWGLRLSLYLARRNLGILGGHGGEDKRYVAMRQRAEKKGMSEMVWRSPIQTSLNVCEVHDFLERRAWAKTMRRTSWC